MLMSKDLYLILYLLMDVQTLSLVTMTLLQLMMMDHVLILTNAVFVTEKKQDLVQCTNAAALI